MILGDKQALGTQNGFFPPKIVPVKLGCLLSWPIPVSKRENGCDERCPQRQCPGDVPYRGHRIPALTAMKSPCQLRGVGETQSRPCKGANVLGGYQGAGLQMESLVSNVSILLEPSCSDLARFGDVSSCDRSDCRCVRQKLGSDFRQTLKVLKVKRSVMLPAVAGGFPRGAGGRGRRRAWA